MSNANTKRGKKRNITEINNDKKEINAPLAKRQKPESSAAQDCDNDHDIDMVNNNGIDMNTQQILSLFKKDDDQNQNNNSSNQSKQGILPNNNDDKNDNNNNQKWWCIKCTYLNDSSRNECEICYKSKEVNNNNNSNKEKEMKKEYNDIDIDIDIDIKDTNNNNNAQNNTNSVKEKLAKLKQVTYKTLQTLMHNDPDSFNLIAQQHFTDSEINLLPDILQPRAIEINDDNCHLLLDEIEKKYNQNQLRIKQLYKVPQPIDDTLAVLDANKLLDNKALPSTLMSHIINGFFDDNDMKNMMSDNNNNNNKSKKRLLRPIIPIHGSPGMGKTTLITIVALQLFEEYNTREINPILISFNWKYSVDGCVTMNDLILNKNNNNDVLRYHSRKQLAIEVLIRIIFCVVFDHKMFKDSRVLLAKFRDFDCWFKDTFELVGAIPTKIKNILDILFNNQKVVLMVDEVLHTIPSQEYSNVILYDIFRDLRSCSTNIIIVFTTLCPELPTFISQLSENYLIEINPITYKTAKGVFVEKMNETKNISSHTQKSLYTVFKVCYFNPRALNLLLDEIKDNYNLLYPDRLLGNICKCLKYNYDISKLNQWIHCIYMALVDYKYHKVAVTPTVVAAITYGLYNVSMPCLSVNSLAGYCIEPLLNILFVYRLCEKVQCLRDNGLLINIFNNVINLLLISKPDFHPWYEQLICFLEHSSYNNSKKLLSFHYHLPNNNSNNNCVDLFWNNLRKNTLMVGFEAIDSDKYRYNVKKMDVIAIHGNWLQGISVDERNKIETKFNENECHLSIYFSNADGINNNMGFDHITIFKSDTNLCGFILCIVQSRYRAANITKDQISEFYSKSVTHLRKCNTFLSILSNDNTLISNDEIIQNAIFILISCGSKLSITQSQKRELENKNNKNKKNNQQIIVLTDMKELYSPTFCQFIALQNKKEIDNDNDNNNNNNIIQQR